MHNFDTSLLLPQPQRIALRDGQCDCAAITAWCLRGELSAEDCGCLDDALAAAFGRRLARAERRGAEVLTLAADRAGVSGKGPESYTLSLDATGVRIAGGTARALYWGVQTLRQVLDLAKDGAVLALEIEDWPAFRFRGYSDDISRRQVSTLKDFEFIIEHLAQLKYNVYQPYMEDMLLIDRQPKLGFKRGRLTRDEVAHMIAYGRRRFVEIMPQFNLCSHCERMLELPEYAAWRFEGNLENLNPELPAVKAFIRDVYAQLFEQFPCTYFHMGLDEARGLIERPELYVNHANWLADLALAAGKTPIMWHDMFVPYHSHHEKYSAKLLDGLNRKIILNQWVYNPETHEPSGFLREMTSRGFTVLLSPKLPWDGCGGGTQAQWRAMDGLLKYGVDNAQVLGVHNTSWNDSGAFNRHLYWPSHAVSAQMIWHGPGPVEQTQPVMRAFGQWFHGLAPTHADALHELAEFGDEHGRVGAWATKLPRVLAQTVTRADVAAARTVKQAVKRLRAGARAAQQAATRNAAHIDHVLGGLDTLRAGAERVMHAPRLRKAIGAGDTAAIDALMLREKVLLHALRAQFGELWLRRHKPEGMEYADMRFRAALSEMETLAWQVATHAQRAAALQQCGFTPLDLAACATAAPADLAPLPLGLCVFDNVPWRVTDPARNKNKSLVWLRSALRPELPESVAIPAGKPARTLHVLHAVYGKDQPDHAPGAYRVVFADGGVQEIALCATRDVGDWWMPFGHMFGGGGALRIDPAQCRLAYLSGPEEFQGHCLFHFWAALTRPDQVIERIEVRAGSPEVSLIVAAMTLEA